MFDHCHLHIIVSLSGDGKYGPLLREAGIPVYCLNLSKNFMSIFGLIRLIRLIVLERPDIVQTWLYHADLIGGIVAKITRVNKIFWGVRHGNLSPSTMKLGTIRVAKVCALLSNLIPTKIISCSKRAINAHVDIGYKKEKFIDIPNGYDLKHLSIDSHGGDLFIDSVGLALKGPVIGMVARFDIQKDHRNLLKALSNLKHSGYKFNCLLAGNGMNADNQVLMGWIAEDSLEDSIFLLGECRNICAMMNAIDIHVLSSLGEGFPNVVAEAMACGTPCVVTDVGDSSFIVGDTGWVVPPKNPKELARGIKDALDALQSERWVDRRIAARARIADNFDIHRMVTKYNQAWQEF
jgi:glycosyltransferase involved in cell wall biosynthesis